MSYDLGTAHGKITLDYNGDAPIARAEDDIDRLSKRAKDSDKQLGLLGKTLNGLGSAVKLTGLSVALTNAAFSAAALGIQVAGIIPQLASVASLAAALPGLFVGVVAVAGVLTAVMSGVGDAITAAFDTEHPEKFEEALKKLSPSARKFAESVKEMVPGLKDFQQGLQESFFATARLSIRMPFVMKALQALRPQLNGLASEFGAMARQFVEFGVRAKTVKFVSDAIGIFRETVKGAIGPMSAVLTGLRDVGIVGLPLLRQLGQAVNQVALQFGEWLSEIAADGRLQEWINTALQTLRTLGDIVGAIGSILNSVLTAANETGGGLLNTIAAITGQFASFLRSAEGSAAIRSLFTGIMDVARQLAPIFTTLVKVIAGALGPALTQIATGIGPVLLDVINRLAPAFGPLVNALVSLMVAVAPLLPPIAQLVALLAGVLTTAVQALVAELGPLIDIFAQGLTQAITAFMPVIGEMAKGLPLAAQAGIQLAAAFAPLVPVMVQLAQVIATSLIAVMPQLLAAAQQLVPVIVQFAAAFAENLAVALEAVAPYLPFLIQGFIGLLPYMLQVLTLGLRLATWALNFVTALRNLATAVVGFASRLVSSFGNIRSAADLLVALFVRLPGRVMGAIASLAGSVPAFFRAVWSAAQRVTSAVWNAIVSFMGQLPRRIRGALSSLSSIITSLIRAAWNAARGAFQAGANTVVSIARGIGGRIRSALGNVGGLLVSAGRSIINGLANGIQAGIGRVLGMVSGLANRVRGAFNSALSIFSPSKDFYESGVNIIRGLINGLKSQLTQASRMAQVVAKTVIQPTLTLPAAATTAASSVIATLRPTQGEAYADGTQRTFGPYNLVVDGKVLTSIVIDAVTGNPKVVSKAANEGNRQSSWNGKGS